MPSSISPLPRRTFLRSSSALLAAACIARTPAHLLAQDLNSLQPLNVASAGAARQMLEGPLKAAAAQALKLDLITHAQGADTVARMLADNSLKADIFIPITASPLSILMHSGKTDIAYPIARSELVLLYSPKSRFIAQFEDAANGKADWWKILQKPGIRIARSNPANDPSGRAIFFMMMLAARKYAQPDLVEKILGSPLNPAQVLGGRNNQARLQSGEIDAMAVYKTGPANNNQPYLSLAEDINLSRLNVRSEHPDLHLTIDDQTFYPEPLVFYAALLKDAQNPSAAAAFLTWLQGEQAQTLFRNNHFAPPAGATPIHA